MDHDGHYDYDYWWVADWYSFIHSFITTHQIRRPLARDGAKRERTSSHCKVLKKQSVFIHWLLSLSKKCEPWFISVSTLNRPSHETVSNYQSVGSTPRHSTLAECFVSFPIDLLTIDGTVRRMTARGTFLHFHTWEPPRTRITLYLFTTTSFTTLITLLTPFPTRARMTDPTALSTGLTAIKLTVTILTLDIQTTNIPIIHGCFPMYAMAGFTGTFLSDPFGPTRLHRRYIIFLRCIIQMFRQCRFRYGW